MTSDLSLVLFVGSNTPDGFVRLDTTDMGLLGVSVGDVVAMEGTRRSLVRVIPAFMEDRNQKIARVSKTTADNIGYLHGRSVSLFFDRNKPPSAELVTLEAKSDLDRTHLLVRQDHLGSLWQNRVLTSGDKVFLPTLDAHPLMVRVAGTQPAGSVSLTPTTQFIVATPDVSVEGASLPVLGGHRDLYMTCRDLASLRFKKNGRPSACSVLLSGPSGCGKASLVKRLAKELGASFRLFDVYQLLDQFVARGSTELSLSLSELARRGPVIILIDHIEALYQLQKSASSLASAAHAILAQICGVLEEVPMQPDMMLFAVTSGPLDARLRKGSLFSLCYDVDPPNRWGRHEVLLLATAGRKLTQDVDLASLAEISGGTKARDLISMVDAAALSADEAPLTQNDLMSAFRSFCVPATDEVRCDVPAVAWNEIAGLDDIKKHLHETLSWSLLQHEKFAAVGVRPPCSILLSGGQGTGKTALVRALANFMPMNFIEVGCMLLVTREPSEGKTYARDVFALARRKAPCLIFLDDVDALFSGEPSPQDATFAHPVVEQLMTELDAVADIPGIVVIAATNRPDRLTGALLRAGRFDFSLALPLPDGTARKKILQICVRKMPLAADIDFDSLAMATRGFSPADIANLCNRVGLMAFRRSLSGPDGGVIPPVVDVELFEQGLRGLRAD